MDIKVIDWLTTNRDRLLKTHSFKEAAAILVQGMGYPSSKIDEIASWLQYGTCKCDACAKGRKQ